MADKRMFSKKITNSDAFLDMPKSAQALYFHLSMEADDEGFLNSPKRILRMTGCSDDDFKILVAKRFILLFDSGVIVIKHWRINNYLRGDRFNATQYTEERKQLAVKENGAYTMHISEMVGIPNDNQMATNGIPMVYTDKNSIEENRIDKNRTDIEKSFAEFWAAYPKKVGKEAAYKAFEKVIKKTDVSLFPAIIQKQRQSEQWKKDNGQFIPNPATWLNQGRWEDELTTSASKPSGDRRAEVEEMLRELEKLH